MTKPLSWAEIDELIDQREGPCISLFMPAHTGSDAVKQNPIRFKNLLREAERRLRGEGMRDRQVSDLLRPAAALTEDRTFWQRQSDGLAAYLAPGFHRFHLVALPLEEFLSVGGRFHVAPLVPLVTAGHFYLLALSQNARRLFECTPQSIREVDLQELPHSLADALGYDRLERQLHLYSLGQPGVTPRPSGVAGTGAMFHGHGVEVDDAKQDLLRYFQRLDRGLREYLRAERAPLVLAAVDYLHPLYREANTYPGLVEPGVVGSPDLAPANTLHRQALPVVEQHLQAQAREAAAEYQRLAGTPRASNDIKDILPQAHRGRVQVLLVRFGLRRWGAFDPAAGTVELHDQPHPGDEELVDLTVVETIRRDGKVWAVDPETVPQVTLMGAIYRY